MKLTLADEIFLLGSKVGGWLNLAEGKQI